MILGIDHVVIACVDPDGAAAALERQVGLAAGEGGRHDALGTYNRIAWLGDSYIELLGVFDRDLAARSWVGALSLQALAAGGGFATWAVATDRINDDVALLNEFGANLGAPIDGERRRPDGAVVRWRLAAPSRPGAPAPPFLIEHDPTAAEWTSSARAVRASQIHPIGTQVRLKTLELEVSDIDAAGDALTKAVGIGPFRASASGRATRDASIGRQMIRLRAEIGSVPLGTWPVASIHLLAAPLDSVATPAASRALELLGCRFIVTT
jgi:hypothetical protein